MKKISISLIFSVLVGISTATAQTIADGQRYTRNEEFEKAEIIVKTVRLKENNLPNLHVYANINGMSAYDMIDVDYLVERLKVFLPEINIRISQPPNFPFAKGLLTHYYVLKPEDYAQL